MKKSFTFLCAISMALLTYADAQKDIPANCGDKVEITATPKTGYHFVEWQEDGITLQTRQVDATGNATYTAVFAINQYTITFLNGDGSTMQSGLVNYGVVPTSPVTTPTKEATAQYSYTFSGWSPTIYPADKDQVYTPLFDQTVNKYTITFKNWDGSILQSSDWDYGSTPSYSGTPTKPADAQYTYTFQGWDHEISPVTGEATYTAVFDNNTNSYNVTTGVVTAGTGIVSGDGTFAYGTSTTVTATPAECYEFVRWLNGSSEVSTSASYTFTVTGNVTLTAEFKKISYIITVRSADATQGEIDGHVVTP